MIFASAAAVCCLWIGIALSLSQKTRVRFFSETEGAFAMLSSMIRQSNARLPVCLKELSSRALCGGLFLTMGRRLGEKAESPSEAYAGALTEFLSEKAQRYLTAEDRTVLKLGASVFGDTKDGLLASAENFCRELSAHRQRILPGCDKNAKLYASLGALGGLLMMILLA